MIRSMATLNINMRDIEKSIQGWRYIKSCDWYEVDIDNDKMIYVTGDYVNMAMARGFFSKFKQFSIKPIFVDFVKKHELEIWQH